MYRIFRRKTNLKTFVAVYCQLQLLFKSFKVIKVPFAGTSAPLKVITATSGIAILTSLAATTTATPAEPVHLCNELTAATVAPQEEPY